MRPISRRSTRLAGYHRICHSPARRSFQTSAQRSSDPRPPNSNSDDSSSFHHNRAEYNGRDAVAGSRRNAAESGHDDAENANEYRRSSFRRLARLKRTSEVPRPPPIPEWFMKHNVILAQNSSHFSDGEEVETKTIQCVLRKSGEVLFEIPYYDPKKEKAAEQEGKDKETTNEPDQTEQRQDQHIEVLAKQHDIARFDAEARQAIRDLHAAVVNAGRDRDIMEELPKLRSRRDSRRSRGPTSSSVPPSLANLVSVESKSAESISAEFKSAESKSANSSREYGYNFRLPPEMMVDLFTIEDPMRWAFLEAEAGIQAALALPVPATLSSSFAANRVDLSLNCSDPCSHEALDRFVAALARHAGADVLRLDANDIAELTADYVGQGRDEPGSFANLGYDVFDGRVAAGLADQSAALSGRSKAKDEDEAEEDEDDESDETDHTSGTGGDMTDLRRALLRSMSRLRGLNVDVDFVPPPKRLPQKSSTRSPQKSQSGEVHWDDARLSALVDQILDAPGQKQSLSDESNKDLYTRESSRIRSNILRMMQWNADRKMHTSQWRTDTAGMLAGYSLKLAENSEENTFDLRATSSPLKTASKPTLRRTVVHVRDLIDLCESQLGNEIVNTLLNNVQKRRRAGEQIVIVGTSAHDVPGAFSASGEASEDHSFRNINIPPLFELESGSRFGFTKAPKDYLQRDEGVDSSEAYWRILEVNLRHLQSMLRILQPGLDIDLLYNEVFDEQFNVPGMRNFAQRVFSFDQVQRLALTAIGLCQDKARAAKVLPFHLALANLVTVNSDFVSTRASMLKERKDTDSRRRTPQRPSGSGAGSPLLKTNSRLAKIKASCNQHETRLCSGVVDPEGIKIGFRDVHAPEDTIDSLKMLTSLSLLRPDAFKYGVLAKDRLSGLLLYGPPGTGKTLLAKAVAKESKATVMEVSGAQIYEKYVGEGEKMVRAVFSLAKKISPCVVFMDEADAIFGSRTNATNRTTHREIINQFLREWDGMDDHGVFLMVATNRPFDLDDAVLRRLPRRLLVDLPVAKDRESILGIHLRDENLDSAVSLSKLAEQTPLYSGSDLKNLAVAAALAAVREENAKKQEDPEYSLPEKRTLTEKHFEKALTEISASISEDMSTLNAIRKFDEQYGDRKGRRKKSGMGFGANDGPVDEGAARIRHAPLPGTVPDSGPKPGESPPPP